MRHQPPSWPHMASWPGVPKAFRVWLADAEERAGIAHAVNRPALTTGNTPARASPPARPGTCPCCWTGASWPQPPPRAAWVGASAWVGHSLSNSGWGRAHGWATVSATVGGGERMGGPQSHQQCGPHGHSRHTGAGWGMLTTQGRVMVTAGTQERGGVGSQHKVG